MARLHAVRRSWRQITALAAVGVFTLTTVYEAAQALGLISLATLPGEDASGAEIVNTAAAFAFLATLSLVLLSLGDAERIGRRTRQLLPLAATATVVVGYVTFDPYFAPGKRRYSDYASTGQTAWMCFVVAFAFVTAIVARFRLRLGMMLTLVLLILLIPTTLLGAFH